jgi:hypothetical protein
MRARVLLPYCQRKERSTYPGYLCGSQSQVWGNQPSPQNPMQLAPKTTLGSEGLVFKCGLGCLGRTSEANLGAATH